MAITANNMVTVLTTQQCQTPQAFYVNSNGLTTSCLKNIVSARGWSSRVVSAQTECQAQDIISVGHIFYARCAENTLQMKTSDQVLMVNFAPHICSLPAPLYYDQKGGLLYIVSVNRHAVGANVD